MIWEERISNWFGGWKDVFNLESVSETDSVLKIKDFIKDKGFVTRKYIGLSWLGCKN